MKRVLLSLTLLVVFGLSAMSQAVVYSDNFDSYTAGDQLAAQNNVNWTTWSNAPGSAEDPYISTDQSISAPNSVVIEGTNDCVLLLGDKTQGKYNLKFNMFVPTGYLGYFNVLHLFAGASSEWGLQVYFDQGGLGLVDGGGAGAGAFTFSYDQWINLKVFVDLDEDWCDFYVNNNLVIGYQWSLGTFGTPGLNQLGAANFYAWSDALPPKYYIENVVYEAVTSSLITEDFESYTVGQQLVVQAVAQGLDYWTTWSGNPGTTEDPNISAEQTHGGGKSVVCQGVNDFVMLFGDKTAGKYSVDFYLYIPTGKVGYYNILQAFGPGGANTTWGLEIYYNPGGIAEVTADGVTGVAVFNYGYDQWIHMENIIDLNNDEATLIADGVEILTWQWSNGASGGGINALAGMDIYAATTNGTPYFFVDDINYIELEAPYGPPIITVSPASLSATLQSGATAMETLTIGNDGIADLEWNAYVHFPSLKSNPVVNQVIENEVTIKPAVNPEFSIVKNEPTPGINHTDETVTIHYDGDNANSVGLTSGGTLQVGAMFPASMTDGYIGMEITEVDVFIGDVVTQATLMIYGHGAPDAPGALLAQQNFNPSADVWTTIVLTDPIMISGGDIWVTYSCTHDAGLYPAGGDAGPPVTNGDWFKSGASWVPMHVANPALLLNWNIRAIADGNPMDAWLSIDPVYGEIITGETNDVDVMFDASGLTNGTYTAEIIIMSNDPAMPTKTVPVTMTVSGMQLDPPTNLESEVIGNDVSLTWTAPGPPPAFYEDFEGTYPPTGWLKLSPDGGTGWEALAVGTTPLPGWTGGEATACPDGGTWQAYCTWTTGGATSNDQWLITPQQTVGSNSVLEFYMVYYESSYADHVEIRISTTSQNQTSAFNVVVDQIDFNASSSTEWQLYSYDLTDYVDPGTDVYIAFRENIADNFNDGSAISIDNVYVGAPMKHAVAGTIVPSNSNISKGSNQKDLNYVHVPSVHVVAERGLLGYNVYRNNVKINSSLVTVTEYLDSDLWGGTYTWYVTAVYDEGESGPSNTVTEVIVGIDETSNSNISIYPNPANGLVNIESPSTINSIRMMNYTGQMVYQSTTPVNQVRINTADMPAGVYFLMIETGEGMINQKLVVK